MTVMRPHVDSSILNLANHQVSEDYFTGNPQRTTASEDVCKDQIHIFANTSQQKQCYGDINLYQSEKNFCLFKLFSQDIQYFFSKTPLLYECCSLAMESGGEFF